ncbi:Gp37-like protein [Eubacterium limosum]|uniref:Gp28/Gp37-like domain-containing protein n=1 Tax=Eubacterium limosum TaxID=1736 RepID=A0AAC9QSQ0_EUBLI|nr:hypothetical protein [Eubacterium limosum]ARD65013.1 hypothetical protein B2M23_05410 [Eubacterium limosum]PWW52961.1 ReqiPepy6 Gp37-like protein [Eubacterium limosum]UQZ20965.1 hypothetical protein M5595_12020 [Eubacterium limosum]
MPGLQEIEQPTSIRFYNEEREFIGEIDNFTSAVYVRRWETFGNFEIHFTEDRPDLFVPGYYIMINNDRYRNGIIQYYKNDSDGYEPKSLKDIVIKGFSLLYLLYWRLTEPPATNNGYWVWNNKPVEDIMCDLVNEQVVHPADPARTAKEMRVLQSQHRGIKITFQSRFKYLTDELFELSRQSGLGPVIWLDTDNKQFVFEVLEGKDCTHRIDNPNSYIFSKGSGKVTKRTYTYSCEGEKNMAYIGGQGDGDEREVVKINAHLTGLQRKEMFIDARDIAEGETDSLLDRGKLKLSAAAATVSYIFDADTQDYGRSWDLGDLATYVDENGFVEDNRITQVREVYENSVLKIAPTFGYGKQTFVDNLHANTVTMTNERVGISGKFKDLYAENATIKNAIIEKADIKDLNAVTATVETLRAQTAEIQVLVADKASIGDLNAATARITELEADTADIRKAIIDVAHIGDLTAITADITSLKADVADIDTAMIGKADIDLANIKNGCITTAMIGTGVIGTTQIADGSITDAKIVGLTANKITAGRLDAAQIEVVNLNAANITVGTINGVQIAPGAITGDKLAQQVNDQITGAANAAQQAQTTADGKNKIYYQATQPGLTGNKEGDTWFDTANGYRAYIWNGTAWSLSPFGSAAIADDAVTLAKVGADLQSFMDGINNKALAAQTSADGKNTVFYQATQPPITGRKTGDTWYNTAKDNAISKWDGGKWTEITFGAGAISDSIISAEKLSTDIANKLNTAASDAATAKATADTAKANASAAQTAANAAKDAAAAADILAKAAQTSANSAQTTADGKNTVFYAATAPPVTGRKTNDIWFDTAGDNRMYYWNGTAWTLRQFGTNALANLSITNALIANAAIDNAKIANLDAGKITTGIISADRIGAGSLTVGKLTEAALTEIQKPAVDAKAAADAAANAAATAQGTADTAKTNAASAQSAADAAKATLAAWCYNNNLTYIDGGDIYTGTVTAAKIAAGAISTEKLAANAITGDKIAGKTISADKIVAGTITANSGVIANGAILTAMIGDAQIGTAKIANLAVTGAKIANATITNAQIADATIQSAKIAALDAGKITTGILAAARIAAGSITADKLASKSITVGQINDAAIKAINDLITIGARNLLRNSGTPTTNTTYGTRVFNTSGLKPNTKYTFVVNGFTSSASQKIGLWFNGGSSGGFFVNPTTTAKTQFVVCTTPATLTTTNVNIYNYPSGSTSCTINWACLYEGEIKPPMDWTPAPEDDTTAIAENSIANWCYNNNLTYINGGKIYTGTVTATQIAANAIVAGKIAANAVTASTIVAGAVTLDKLAANSVNASKIVAGSITAAQLAANTITGDKIAATTIAAGNLAANSITSDKIVADAITTAKIAAKAVTANEIAAGTITAAQIAANAITATQLAAGAVTAVKIAAGQITADKIAAGAITADKFYGTAITSNNYVANSAGMKINLANGTIDTKNFKVDSAGNVAMTGTLTMQGAQSMTVKNASATLVGTVAFKAVSGQTWSPGALNVLGKDLLHLAAGDASTTKAFVEGYAGGYNLFEMGREGSNYGVWIGTSPTARIGVSNAQSPQVYAEGCTKEVDFTPASGFSKMSGYMNKIIYNAFGKFCFLAFTLSGNITAGPWVTVLTLPAGYRPSLALTYSGNNGIRGLSQIRINPNGTVQAWGQSNLSDISYTAFYYVA